MELNANLINAYAELYATNHYIFRHESLHERLRIENREIKSPGLTGNNAEELLSKQITVPNLGGDIMQIEKQLKKNMSLEDEMLQVYGEDRSYFKFGETIYFTEFNKKYWWIGSLDRPYTCVKAEKMWIGARIAKSKGLNRKAGDMYQRAIDLFKHSETNAALEIAIEAGYKNQIRELRELIEL